MYCTWAYQIPVLPEDDGQGTFIIDHHDTIFILSIIEQSKIIIKSSNIYDENGIVAYYRVHSLNYSDE